MENSLCLNEEKKKKVITIMGISIWKIFAYFIIYSVAGFVVETIYALITKSTWESRQSFLYGPFCAIYGVGGVILVLFLRYFNKNNFQLFLGGFIVGSVVEYLVSLFAEIFLNVKWWDYSNQFLNINGRICLLFSIYWGVLSIYFMSYVHPKVDKLIESIKKIVSINLLKHSTIFVIVFLIIDCLLTAFALDMFATRKIYEHALSVENKQYVYEKYDKIYTNANLAKVINTFFSDEKMIKTFPNLKIQDVNGNIIYFNTLVEDVNPYYYKFEFKN